jgi:prevent-host-death family protein
MAKEAVMKIEVGAYEAKTRLPELLRAVKAGKRFTITNRGEPIADLVPSTEAGRGNPREAIEKFRAFMQANPVKGRVNIRRLIEEGRE